MSQAKITIREARPEDSSGIATIQRELGWFEQVKNGSPAHIQANIAERIEQCRLEKNHTVLVAERAYSEIPGKVVGYVSVHWYPNLTLGNNGYVSELFIHPSETGKGIGGCLLDKINDYALRRGCTRLLLMNRRIRESYQRGFYAKHGWKEQPDGAFFVFDVSEQLVMG